MNFFRFFTPISYWVLIILWSFIFIFYLRRIFIKKLDGKLFATLLIILAIDAFRTLFESIYFGVWYTSLVGFIPIAIHNFLIRPEFVFIPKILNVIAAVLVILIVLRHWLPEEEAENKKRVTHLRELENEINERKHAEKEKEELILKLQTALNEVNKLQGLLPICAKCKNIRDEKGYWSQIESYIESHTDAKFSHGLCGKCMEELYGDQNWYKKQKKKP
ncbi:MAG: hypothetical protein KAR38_13755 [Calditrichia bacterium]|nr:hypothetical protein [Calditrichia bacterium]